MTIVGSSRIPGSVLEPQSLGDPCSANVLFETRPGTEVQVFAQSISWSLGQ